VDIAHQIIVAKIIVAKRNQSKIRESDWTKKQNDGAINELAY